MQHAIVNSLVRNLKLEVQDSFILSDKIFTQNALFYIQRFFENWKFYSLDNFYRGILALSPRSDKNLSLSGQMLTQSSLCCQ